MHLPDVNAQVMAAKTGTMQGSPNSVRAARTCDPALTVLRSRLSFTSERPLALTSGAQTLAGRFKSRGNSKFVEVAATPNRQVYGSDRDGLDAEATVQQVADQEQLNEDVKAPPFEIEDVPTLPIMHLDGDQALERIVQSVYRHAQNHYHAFFSSELGGVVTDPALMMIHMDDHLVHRGHGVFDTALVVDGQIYMLDRHLQRLANSAMKAGIELPSTLAQIRRAIVETVAYSRKMSGLVRYWLGGGRGGFAISSQECLSPSFYCMMTTLKEGPPTLNPASDYLRGRRVKTSPIPAKHPYFAGIKSNNYLPNVLATLDAESEGKDYRRALVALEFDCSQTQEASSEGRGLPMPVKGFDAPANGLQGIFLDDDGNIAEGPTMNVAILTQDGELVVPPFDQCLPGLTIIRLMELIEENIESLRDETNGALSYVSQRPFNQYEVYDCREAFLIGSTTYVTGIVQWDEKDLGSGSTGDEPGVISLILRGLLKRDLEPLEGPRENFTPVDYGILTNME